MLVAILVLVFTPPGVILWFIGAELIRPFLPSVKAAGNFADAVLWEDFS